MKPYLCSAQFLFSPSFPSFLHRMHGGCFPPLFSHLAAPLANGTPKGDSRRRRERRHANLLLSFSPLQTVQTEQKEGGGGKQEGAGSRCKKSPPPLHPPPPFSAQWRREKRRGERRILTRTQTHTHMGELRPFSPLLLSPRNTTRLLRREAKKIIRTFAQYFAIFTLTSSRLAYLTGAVPTRDLEGLYFELCGLYSLLSSPWRSPCILLLV